MVLAHTINVYRIVPACDKVRRWRLRGSSERPSERQFRPEQYPRIQIFPSLRARSAEPTCGPDYLPDRAAKSDQGSARFCSVPRLPGVAEQIKVAPNGPFFPRYAR